jgi:hypothetical protein
MHPICEIVCMSALSLYRTAYVSAVARRFGALCTPSCGCLSPVGAQGRAKDSAPISGSKNVNIMKANNVRNIQLGCTLAIRLRSRRRPAIVAVVD